MLVKRLYFLTVLVFLSSNLVLADAFPNPTCTELKRLWNTKFVPELQIEASAKELDATCDGPMARFAYSVEYLHRHIPEMYRFLSGKIKKLQFQSAPTLEPDPSLSEEEKKKKQAELNTVLADTERETGTITIYDHLLTEGREYIAAQVAHEAAHLRPEDTDHIKCEQGELKGDEGACADAFTGERNGDSYNFTFWTLKKFYEISLTDPEIDQADVLESIRYVLKNNFNSVPEEVLENWLSDDPSLEARRLVRNKAELLAYTNINHRTHGK